MKRCLMAVLLGFFCVAKFSMAEHCPNCIVNWCQTTYPTYGDYDGDGMNDEYEMQFARQFKPTLYYDDANSEISYCMPYHYDVPFYADDSQGHNAPPDVICDGSVYVHVRPYGIGEPGQAMHIEVAYWFYYTYNQAECQNGYLQEHGHDWEHIALCLSVPPDGGPLQIVSIFFAQHEGWEIRGPDEVQWTGTPGLSSVKVYIVNGSHASYPCAGERCARWEGGFCVCHENANGQRLVEIPDSKIFNLYELGYFAAPEWLDYSTKWPGQSSMFGEPPYGPAWGNHAHWWNEGHFINPFLCIETWRDDVDPPVNFQVSKFRDGQPLTNALYLTWDGPSGWDGFMLRRCLVPIRPNEDDPTCECIAQLGPDTYSYFDSCLDGGGTYYYELKTFNDNPEPSYRGCSWPAQGAGTPSGGPCTYDMSPTMPRVKSCDSCILRWDDYSWNEDGFIIRAPGGEICDTMGRNVEEYPVSNCCTGKRGYSVGAYNEYGTSWSLTLGCNHPPDCQPRLGCDGNPDQAPSMNRWGVIILTGLIIGTTAFLMNRKKEKKGEVL